VREVLREGIAHALEPRMDRPLHLSLQHQVSGYYRLENRRAERRR
jgi:hypothetical protein